MLFKFNAEHINRRAAVKLVRELEDKGIEVEYANVGAMFTDELDLVITGDQVIADAVRARLWEINHGTWCDMQVITEDELDVLF